MTTKSWRKNLLQIMLKNCAGTRKLSGQNKVQNKNWKNLLRVLPRKRWRVYIRNLVVVVDAFLGGQPRLVG